MKNKVIIMLFILLTIYYFEYAVTITWDSAHYLEYVKIFENVMPFSSWDVVRGPIFPLIIYCSNFLFSKTNHGLLVMTYMYYLVMLLFNIKILNYYLDKIKIKKNTKKIIKYIFVGLIIINPIIYGYYHCLLTEFVAITLAIISCYYAVIWLDVDYYKEKNKYILLNLLFIFLTLFSWFLKQPYVSCGFFALFIAYIISIIQYKNKKIFIIRTITILSCVIFLFVGIKIWNVILNSNGNDTSTNRNPTNSLGNQLIIAVDYLDVINNNEIYDKQFINNSLLSKEKEDINKLLKDNKKYVLIYNYNEKDIIIDVDYIRSSNGNTISMVSSLGYILKSFVNNPVKLINSYVTNYFSIIDIYGTNTNNGIDYKSTREFNIGFSNEITAIGNKPYNIGESNLFYLSDSLYENVKNYETVNYANKYLNKLMLILSKVTLLIFKIVFFLLPVLFIISIVMRFSKLYRKYINILNLVIILFGFSFLHLLLHTVTGAIIDRYALPCFITTILGILMFGSVFIAKKKNIN